MEAAGSRELQGASPLDFQQGSALDLLGRGGGGGGLKAAERPLHVTLCDLQTTDLGTSISILMRNSGKMGGNHQNRGIMTFKFLDEPCNILLLIEVDMKYNNTSKFREVIFVSIIEQVNRVIHT